MEGAGGEEGEAPWDDDASVREAASELLILNPGAERIPVLWMQYSNAVAVVGGKKFRIGDVGVCSFFMHRIQCTTPQVHDSEFQSVGGGRTAASGSVFGGDGRTEQTRMKANGTLSTSNHIRAPS